MWRKYRKLRDRDVVIHVVASLNFGGVEKRMEMLARSAALGAWQHRFCAIGNGGAAEKRIKDMGAPVDCLGVSVAIPSIRSIWLLFCTFRRLRPQVVHTYGAEANFHGLIAARLAGVPVRIAEEIGIPSHSDRARWVFRQIYRSARRVIGIAAPVKRWLVESHEVPDWKALTIEHQPVEMPNDATSSPGEDGKRFRMIFVGRLESVKNPIILLDAMARIQQEMPAEIWLVGDGSQRSMLEKRAVELGVNERVHMLGYRECPADFVSQCDLFVQPSLSEGFSRALVEAMGCGVPVLASAVGGAPEIIDHGRTGWLLEQPTVEQLVADIRNVWMNRERLALVGRAGRESVLKRFEPTAYLQELEALYGGLRNSDIKE